MPSHRMLAIFRSHGYSKTSMLEVGQVRDVVTNYIKSNDLVAKDDQRCGSFYVCTVHPYIIMHLLPTMYSQGRSKWSG